MGCAGSSLLKREGHQEESEVSKTVGTANSDDVKKLQKPRPWKHPQSIDIIDLKKMRDEFWDTAPHYGGQKEIWDALRAAAESDISLGQAIIDSAGIILSNADMTTCYDERGFKYELPKYVLSEPTNLNRDS